MRDVAVNLFDVGTDNGANEAAAAIVNVTCGIERMFIASSPPFSNYLTTPARFDLPDFSGGRKLRLKVLPSLWQNTKSMGAKTFFRELRRRNVLKVALAYAVIAWLVVEATCLLLFGHEERSSAMTALIVILAIGFGVILYISWAFEATPEGLKRTANVPPDTVLPSWSRRKFTAFIIVVAALAASLLVFDIVRSRPNPTPSPATVAP